MTTKKPIDRATKQRQKEHLKTLVDNSNVSHLRSTGRIVKYGAAGFKRNFWLSIAATLVMTITLIILLVTVGASIILSATADTMREKIDITVFFTPGTNSEALEAMATEMRSEENVTHVEVTTSEDELRSLLDENRDNPDLIAALEDESMYNTMLSTMQATMRIKVHNPDDLSGIRYIVENSPQFKENLDLEKKPTYDANQAEIATISSWATVAKNGGLILGAVFLVISILVIFNTIRMAIFSRREEIHMMKLVGADTNFIRGPFLIEAQICGIISGILASTAAYFGFKFLAPKLASYGIDVSHVSDLMFTNHLVLVFLVVIGIGMIVGTISAHLAMRKYLK